MAYSALYKKLVTLFDHVPPHIINLGMGSPSDALLKGCSQVFKTAAAHRMDQDDSYLLFQYGPEIGDRKYREAVSKVLTEEYQSPVDVDDIVATSGATHGLHMIAHLLFSPGDIAFVENPTYFLANTMFKDDAGLVLRGVPMDDEGIIPEALEQVILANKDYKPRQLTEKKPYWGILYVLSCFQNPRGMNLPSDRCKRVVELARKHKLLVVSDDVYNLLYHDKPPRRLFTYDDKKDPDYFGNVVSNGSFSKVFGPGMRLGWLEAPKRVSDTLLSSPNATSSGAFNHTASGIMTSVINLGLLQERAKLGRAAFSTQCEALCDAIRTEIPQAEFTRPYGGFFVWIKLPEQIDGKKLLQLCKEKYDVAFCPGELTSVDGSFKNYIRLAFCHYEPSVLKEAAGKIGQAVKEMLEN